MVLFPRINPYRTGYIPVSKTHRLYYELCGNPNGKPVIYLHGGPGAGVSGFSRLFFNPRVWKIILFDQRGAGKSTPNASIAENTTAHLVEDIRKLLDHLGVKKTFVFGGSWGSTLALAYAIKYPQSVAGMVLRGIFFGNKRDIDYFYRGGTYNHNPEAWERFVKEIPPGRDVIKEYVRVLDSSNRSLRERLAYEWCFYESVLCHIHPNHSLIHKDLKMRDTYSFARIEAHYMINNCFLPSNYLLSHAKRLAHLPITIVHGRYDVVCPVANAYELHKKLPKSKLIITPLSGHAVTEPENQEALVREMRAFEKIPL